MGMTMTQKILAFHAGLDKVSPGQLINAKLDIVLGNDITTPVAVNEFNKAGFDKVFDKDKVAIVLDHFVPNKDIKAAQQSKQCREYFHSQIHRMTEEISPGHSLDSHFKSLENNNKTNLWQEQRKE